jgi:hypothetical protein
MLPELAEPEHGLELTSLQLSQSQQQLQSQQQPLFPLIKVEPVELQ